MESIAPEVLFLHQAYSYERDGVEEREVIKKLNRPSEYV